MNEVKLKPCPFCGAGVMLIGAYGIHVVAADKGCDICLEWCEIDAWNTRTPDPAITALQKELADAKAHLSTIRAETIKALEELDDYRNKIGGCTDGNCIIVKPKGMHTNGGCHCNTETIKITRLTYAYTTFSKAIRNLGDEG